MKHYKISIHIPFYIDDNYKGRFLVLKKVCKNYLQLSKHATIFVHTNKFFKKKLKKIKFIQHNLESEHPHKLTWKCRKLMYSQKNDFDIFIYGEDDVIFSKINFKYWLKYKNICNNNNYNLGFLRVEVNKKSKQLYLTDQISKIKYYVIINNNKFAKLESSYSGFWIYCKDEFQKFLKTKYWKFNWKWTTASGILLLREMSAIGWHGENLNGLFMNRYKATVIPLVNKRIHKSSFIKHASNKYANDPAGLYGTIKINELLSNNIKIFKQYNFFCRVILRLKFKIYSLLRFNLKNLIKH